MQTDMNMNSLTHAGSNAMWSRLFFQVCVKRHHSTDPKRVREEQLLAASSAPPGPGENPSEQDSIPLPLRTGVILVPSPLEDSLLEVKGHG